MKKIFFFFLLLVMSASTFSQQTNPVPELTKQDYLQKSKNQKKTGWIFLGSGAALVIIGAVIPSGELVYDGICIGAYCSDRYKNDGIRAAFGLTGLVSMLGSVPFFIASGKNKRRAVNVSFKNEPVPQIQKTSFVYKSVPSVSLKISL